MNVSSVFLNINSEDPQRLYAFYRDVVGLPVQEGMGEQALNVAGMTLGFDGHSELKGSAKEPARILFDMFVDDIAAEEARIAGHGVKFIRSQGKEHWGGVISTFADPDGNLVQLMYFDPSAAAPSA